MAGRSGGSGRAVLRGEVDRWRQPRVRSLRPAARDTGTHLPGLDGLRAVAVLAVLGYHLWPGLVPAGFLGVTVFFVLSGFLITRLLLAEHASTDTISLRSFWARRARRLLPASLATLTAVALIWMLEGWLTRAFAADILWSLADLANWHTLASGATYGAAGIDSPVLHFWSLAIEEQSYLVLPLVVWAVVRWRGWSLRTLGRVVLVMLLASLAYTAVHHGNADLIYLSTFSRVAELLIGVLLAIVVARRGTLPSDRAWPVVGSIALGGLLAVMATTSLDAPIYARGGLVVAALLAALALVGAVADGPLARVLGVAPLRAIGRISYAVYLFHWPILMAFREAGIDAWYVAPITLAATFALAALSMAALEQPIRNRRRVLGAPRRLVLAVAVTIVVVCTFGVAPASTDLDFATAQAQFDDLSGAVTDDGSPADASDPLVHLATPTTDLPGPTGPPATVAHPTAMLFGDSTALDAGPRPDLHRRPRRGPGVRQRRMPHHPRRVVPPQLRRRLQRQGVPRRQVLRLDQEASRAGRQEPPAARRVLRWADRQRAPQDHRARAGLAHRRRAAVPGPHAVRARRRGRRGGRRVALDQGRAADDVA